MGKLHRIKKEQENNELAVELVKLENLGSAQSAGAGAERVLMGAFANDVTSILLKSIPDATHSAVWFGTVTSVNSEPSASMFPANAIIVWNKVAS